MKGAGCFCVCSNSRILFFEKPKEARFPIHAYPRTPISIPEIYALMSRFIIHSAFRVLGVLGISCDSEIATSIVEGIAIDVIGKSRIRKVHTENFSTHSDGLVFTITCDRSARVVVPVSIFPRVPFEQRERSEVLGIDNCYLASGKRNLAIQFTEWGCHRLALHGHQVKGEFALPMSPLYLKEAA
jgi:hypothetical protein